MPRSDPVRLGRWWNGCWGTATSKKVWLDQLPDGRFELTWSGGDWRPPNIRAELKTLDHDGEERTGRHVYTDAAGVITALKALLGEDRDGWQEHLYV